MPMGGCPAKASSIALEAFCLRTLSIVEQVAVLVLGVIVGVLACAFVTL